jgi:hypothetical protein
MARLDFPRPQTVLQRSQSLTLILLIKRGNSRRKTLFGRFNQEEAMSDGREQAQPHPAKFQSPGESRYDDPTMGMINAELADKGFSSPAPMNSSPGHALAR